MVYNPATDFIGLWRASGGNVSKAEMPAIDLIISALARAGIINLTVSATAPVANQSTTAWLRAAVPSFSAEGAFFLWDKVTSAYLAATPALFFQFLEACAGEASVSWWTSTGGPPLNTVGSNGDFAIRLDTPYGIYGPKAAGAWPATPIPGTADVLTSATFDNTFGNTRGSLIARGAANWASVPIGTANQIFATDGVDPVWTTLTALLDTLFTNVQGSILFRNAAGWDDLPPGVANQVLATGGPGANPAWAPRAAEFASGTRMLFQQTNAPTGWTKDVTLSDYGLRVVNGAVGITPGHAFSSVFSQSATGSHVLTELEIPSHTHPFLGPGGDSTTGGGAFACGGSRGATVTSPTGGGQGHTHTVDLTLSYVDVIIAQKD